MAFSADIHRRRSLRLKDYDYAQAGTYFVTVCTQNRECLFGEVVDGVMRLNAAGRMVAFAWQAIADHFPQVDVDAFVVMPNHMHGIIVLIGDGRGTACRAPTREQFGKPVPGSIPTIMRSFKSAATKRINELRNTPGVPVWQRNYYEHVIRNEDDLARIREYIASNPLQWALDRENPANIKQREA